MKSKFNLYTIFGGLILLTLIVTYFIQISVDAGSNYITYSPLLAILIFYNPFMLAFYIVLAFALILFGLSKNGAFFKINLK